MAKEHEAEKPSSDVRKVVYELWIDYQDRVRSRGRQAGAEGPAAVRLSITSHLREALEWLVQIILAPLARREHFALVDSVFQSGRPVLEAPWRVADPYGLANTNPDEALPRRALELAETGPKQMTPEEVAFLLLDEAAVTNFSLFLRDLMPDWWLDALALAGGASSEWVKSLDRDEKEAARGGGAAPGEEPVGEEEELVELSDLFAGTRRMERTGPAEWVVALEPGARARLAERAFGDDAVQFELRLHRLADGRAELEMSPPPTKADVELRASFRTGDARTFVIRVPADATTAGAGAPRSRRATRSQPCASLPDEAFAISGGELRTENGIDTLLFRLPGAEVHPAVEVGSYGTRELARGGMGTVCRTGGDGSKRLAIVVGSGPAPGINGVISCVEYSLDLGEGDTQVFIGGPLVDDDAPPARHRYGDVATSAAFGVVHRDLKPANVSPRASGAVGLIGSEPVHVRNRIHNHDVFYHDFPPEQAPARPNETASIADDRAARADVQKALPDRWALIDFWNADGLLYACVLTNDDFQVIELPSPSGEQSARLDRLGAELGAVGDEVPHLEALDDLGALLFRPLLPLLREKGIEGLYLVPHESLDSLPLHAARFGGRYLCDEFSVAYLPSADLLPRLPRPDPTGAALVFANPEEDTRQTLPFSRWEGLQLRDRLGIAPDRCLFGRSATLGAADRWGDCGFIHFACHGDGLAREPHLRLADGWLRAKDVPRKPQLRPGAVVVLNACRTGVPERGVAGEGVDLTTAFLLRGAATVLNTQWRVLDSCAAPAVLAFARRLRAGATPAAAMRGARVALRAMTVYAMLGLMREAARLFAAGSVEAAKLLAQQAWLCWQFGLFEEAVTAAREAAPALRDAGLHDEAEALLERAEAARTRNLPGWLKRTGFDSPVFWGAFRLVGRAT